MLDGVVAGARKARRQKRAAHILDAARQQFVLKGFRGASMADICAAAGTSPGNVYRYFPSKDELVVAVCARECVPLFACNLKGTCQDVVGRLVAILEGGMLHGARDLASEIQSEARRNPAVAQLLSEREATDQAAIIEALQGGQGSGALDPSLDLEAVAAGVLLLRDGLLHSPAGRDLEGARPVMSVVLGTLGALLDGQRSDECATGRRSMGAAA